MTASERVHPVIRLVWTATYATHARVFASALAIIVAAAFVFPELVSVPSLATDAVARPLVLFTSWASAIVAMLVGVEPSWQLYATARSRARGVNLARILFAAALCATLGAWPSGDWMVAWVATASLLGWALLAGGFLGVSLSWSLPTLHLFAALAIGGTNTSHPPAWAWILRPEPTSEEGVLALILLVLGCAVWYRSATSIRPA